MASLALQKMIAATRNANGPQSQALDAAHSLGARPTDFLAAR